MEDRDIKAMSVRCTLCGAASHTPCRDEQGKPNPVPHIARLENFDRIHKDDPKDKIRTDTPAAYKAIFAVADPIVKDFRNDLEIHDYNEIKKHPEAAFLHFSQKSGTHIITLMGADKFPAKGEKCPYLFDTATRERILAGYNPTVEAIRRNWPESAIHYWDGAKLKRLDWERAREIVYAYDLKIREDWSRWA